MRTVTAAFDYARRQPDMRLVRRIEYKRRYWSATAQDFIWESNWTTVPDKYFVSVSSVQSQLDSDTLNEFKVSNITIVLNNQDGHFYFKNPAGFFCGDAVSPVLGYEPYWTKFRLKAGVVLEDDSEELLVMFTGLATDDWKFDSESRKVQIIVQGLESLLTGTSAERIATSITNENAGTGNGSDTEFETVHPGVGGIREVSLAGIKQIEGESYSVSQLNEDSLAAKITFTDPPDVGEIVRISYFYWPQIVHFHEVVELLLDEAGVDSGHRTVEPVVFSNSVINSRNYTSQTDWDAGSKTGIDTAAVPGALQINFQDDIYRTNDGWGESLSGWTQGSFGGTSNWTDEGDFIRNVVSGSANVNGYLYRSNARAVGVFQFDFRFGSTSSNNRLEVGLSVSGLSGPLTILASGSMDFGITFTADTNWHTFKIYYYPTGRWVIYIDGSLKYDSSAFQPPQSSNYMFIKHLSANGSSQTADIRNIYRPVETITAVWESATIDMGSVPTAWGTFDHSEDEQDATVTYQTNVSSDNFSSSDGYVDISAGNIPQSALKRYVKTKITISIVTSTLSFNLSRENPSVNEFTIRWITSSSAIILPNFSGISVYEAIQKVGQYTNYEFGFDSEENFFFRPKTTGATVMTLNESNYVCKVSSMTGGYERMFGRVRATYGAIVREVSDASLSPFSSKAKVKDKLFEITGDSAIEIAPSADIATGMAQELFEYTKHRKIRAKVVTTFVPELELSDVVSVSCINNIPPAKKWFLGDNEVNLGDTDVNLWGAGEQILSALRMRIIGSRIDVQAGRCEFDVEEVPS